MERLEVALRREAVRRRLAGESPEAIARELGRTRQWVAKWTERYDPDDPGWAEGRSRAARRVANRTAAEVEAQVLAVRARLEQNPWAQVGAPAIAWELEKLGALVPPPRTLERILARAGATRRQRAGRRASKGLPDPAPAAERRGDVVQVDLLGPRHLEGGVRFHALNQIDVASHHAGIEIVSDRAEERVIAALDLALADSDHNLHVCDDHGELLTSARLSTPGRRPPANRRAARPPLRLALRARLHDGRAHQLLYRETMCWHTVRGNEPLAGVT